MQMSTKVWVLTYTINEYDQEPDVGYFLAVFRDKPTLTQLAPYIKYLPKDMGEAISVVGTIIDKGSVKINDHTEYELKEVGYAT